MVSISKELLRLSSLLQCWKYLLTHDQGAFIDLSDGASFYSILIPDSREFGVSGSRVLLCSRQALLEIGGHLPDYYGIYRLTSDVKVEAYNYDERFLEETIAYHS